MYNMYIYICNVISPINLHKTKTTETSQFTVRVKPHDEGHNLLNGGDQKACRDAIDVQLLGWTWTNSQNPMGKSTDFIVI